MEKFIVFDKNKCLGCKTCELACAVVHSKSKNLHKAVNEFPTPQYRIDVVASGGFSIPLQCRHCDDAPCVKICPTNALIKDESGIVLYKENKCIGCKYCILVCPFGSIKINSKGKLITKCDLCIERLKNGDMPACVSSCPTKALKFTTPSESLTG